MRWQEFSEEGSGEERFAGRRRVVELGRGPAWQSYGYSARAPDWSLLVSTRSPRLVPLHCG